MRVKSLATLVAGLPKKRISELLKGVMSHSKKKGRFIPILLKDKKWKSMYRIKWPDGEISDIVSLTRARDAIHEFKQYQKTQASTPTSNEMVGGMA